MDGLKPPLHSRRAALNGPRLPQGLGRSGGGPQGSRRCHLGDPIFFHGRKASVNGKKTMKNISMNIQRDGFGGCMWMYDIGQVSCTGGDVDLLDFEECVVLFDGCKWTQRISAS